MRCAPAQSMMIVVAVAAMMWWCADARGSATVSGMAPPEKPMAVDPTTQHFVDATGRVRIFHGVNAVYKIFPWVPETETWSPFNSITTKDCEMLQDWGFTGMRLGAMWPGVEWIRGEYNETYLDRLETIVNCLGDHGIYTLLDAHQDIYNREYCGEGAPDWAVFNHKDGDVMPFPEPLAAPLPVNATTGYPDLEDCLKITFFQYYLTDAVGSAFQNLYDDTDGIQTAFAGFWNAVAKRFANNTYVLGYELINEPWAGNMYEDPEIMLPGRADAENLAPMYAKLNDAIREVDPDHLVFFESAISNFAPTGLKTGPGGTEANDRQVYSYHVYCSPGNSTGDPVHVIDCNAEDTYVFDIKMDDLKSLGCGGYLTEMGAMLQSPTEAQNLDFLLGLADDYLQSWNYWQYKIFHDLTTDSPAPDAESFYYGDGTLQEGKVKTLSRTYAYAIAGKPTSMFFNPDDGYFKLQYFVDTAITEPTEVFVNTAWYYPNGMSVTFQPEDAATWSSIGPNRIAITPSPSFENGNLLTVVVEHVSSPRPTRGI